MNQNYGIYWDMYLYIFIYIYIYMYTIVYVVITLVIEIVVFKIKFPFIIFLFGSDLTFFFAGWNHPTKRFTDVKPG